MVSSVNLLPGKRNYLDQVGPKGVGWGELIVNWCREAQPPEGSTIPSAGGPEQFNGKEDKMKIMVQNHGPNMGQLDDAPSF